LFLKRHKIHKIIYLMVDRTTEFTEVTKSPVNYDYPILIADEISKLENISLIWPSSIFCKDENIVKNQPYLLSQNLAFEILKDSLLQRRGSVARLFLPQIYGSEIYRKHQPFLYKVRDLIRTQDDVILINGKSTFRNFIHEYDISRVLADSKTWIDKIEVQCLFEDNMSWFEITEIMRKSYKSKSQIYDQTSQTVVLPEYRYFNSDTLNVSKRYNLTSFESAIEMGLF